MSSAASSSSVTPKGVIALSLGLVAVSTSGPFFVKAHIDAYAAVFWRTVLAGILGLVIAQARGQLAWPIVKREARGLLLGGFLLGAHFLIWIKSFDLTDFSSNLLLLVSQPILGALLGRAMGERLPKQAWLAIGLAFVGMSMIAGADISLGPRALLGDALCVVASGLIAVFYVVARDARNALPLETYMGFTLLASALTALPVALLSGGPLWGYSAESWGWVWAIVLITTLFGHGLMNFAARHVSLFTLNLVIVLEPPIAIALGAFMLGAAITGVQLAGGALLGVSVLIGLHKPKASDEAEILDSSRAIS